MRRTVLLGLALACAAAVAAQEQPGPRGPRRTFRLAVTNEPVPQVVARICGDAGAPCRIAPELAEMRLTFEITVQTGADPQPALLDFVAMKLRQQRNGVAFRKAPAFALVALGPTEHGREPLRAAPPDPRLQARRAQVFAAVPLREAFQRYFAGTAARLEIEPQVPNPALTLRHPAVTAHEGLLLLYEAARREVPDLRLERDRGVYRLAVGKPGPAPAGGVRTP